MTCWYWRMRESELRATAIRRFAVIVAVPTPAANREQPHGSPRRGRRERAIRIGGQKNQTLLLRLIEHTSAPAAAKPRARPPPFDIPHRRSPSCTQASRR